MAYLGLPLTGEAAECAYFTAGGGHVEARRVADFSLVRAYRVQNFLPTGVAIAKGKAYVTTPPTEDVRVLDLATGAELPAILAGASPGALRAHPTAEKLYLIIMLNIIIDPPPDPPPPTGSEYAVTVISTATDSIVRDIGSLGLSPQGLTFGQDDNHLYVITLGEVTVISTTEDRIIDRLVTPPSTAGAVFGDSLYLGNSTQILRYDLTKREVDFGKPIPGRVEDLAVTPGGDRLVASVRRTDAGVELIVLDAASLETIRSFDLGYSVERWSQVRIASDGSKAFVAVPSVAAYALDLADYSLSTLEINNLFGVGIGECPLPSPTVSPSPTDTPTNTPTKTATAATPSFTTTPLATSTLTPTPPPEPTATGTNARTPSDSRTQTARPTLSDHGGCSMGDRHPAAGFVVASALLVPFLVRRRRLTAPAVAPLAPSAPLSHAERSGCGMVVQPIDRGWTPVDTCIHDARHAAPREPAPK